MKKFISEINKKINLEMNLPAYAEYMMNLYNRRAAVEFAMDYYTYQGMFKEQAVNDTLLAATKQLNEIIREYIMEPAMDQKRETGINKIDTLRNNVYNRVEVLTAFADIFARYEYVTNRCEYLFREPDVNKKYNDEDFTREIMQYIFADEDNAAINSKISEMIGELPLRMTKNKFFEILSDGMSVYSKTDQVTIDDFLYDIRTSSMLELPKDMEQYRDLYEIYREVKNVNFSEIDEQTFLDTESKLRFAGDFIEKETNIYMMLAGLINKAYVMMIALPYADNTTDEMKNAISIIAKINENFYHNEDMTLEEEITERFIFMEGIPEELQGIIQSVEYVLDHIRSDYTDVVKNIMADKMYQGLFICEKLMSDSLFIDLAGEYQIFDEKDVQKPDDDMDDIEKYLNQKRDNLIAELMEFFKNNQKQVNRSVMSLILSRLPVFFNNITEIQDYIYYSLSNCTNKAEKAACIEILKSLMEG
ncbi:MAG: hypothetical protein II919_03265 [Lachnospiraceae bacterium]|nr:hypothetical protein [Lachnospiraceae bacterium]